MRCCIHAGRVSFAASAFIMCKTLCFIAILARNTQSNRAPITTIYAGINRHVTPSLYSGASHTAPCITGPNSDTLALHRNEALSLVANSPNPSAFFSDSIHACNAVSSLRHWAPDLSDLGRDLLAAYSPQKRTARSCTRLKAAWPCTPRRRSTRNGMPSGFSSHPL